MSNLQFKDPWKMLDPHDPGTAQEKPFKKGQLSLSHNCQGSLIKCWGGGVTWDELSSHPGRSSNIPSRFILRKPQCAPAGWGTWLEYRHNLSFFSPFFSLQYSVFPVSGTLLKNNQGQEKLIINKLLSLVFSRSCLKAALFTSQMWFKFGLSKLK